MTLPAGPIAIEELNEPLKKALAPNAPAQLKMMVARGLAPMGPTDLATAIFQLSLDPDEAIAGAAIRTAGTLPEKILQAALVAALDPRVLDFFAKHCLLKPNLVELIILNQATDDETFIFMASH